jgi:alkanesulfonate monooxygenase
MEGKTMAGTSRSVDAADGSGRNLHFGWFIPTYGDSAAFGDVESMEPPGMDLFLRVARAAERSGFEYALVPVNPACWEAFIACAMVAAKSERLKMLVAARPGYISPTLLAKMISTFDQLSDGRISINLIAGGNPEQLAQDGLYYEHDVRYELMDESVDIMKAAWASDGPIDYRGKHYDIRGAVVRPKPLQQPYPRFYIGGESDSARNVGAKHADCYLFWGDTPEKTAEKIHDIRGRAENLGRTADLTFGMRLQVVVRETEAEAWEAAYGIIERVSDEQRGRRSQITGDSQADTRMLELSRQAAGDDYRIAPNLWSGISTVRHGAGVAVVGGPNEVARTLEQFVDIGCTEFCLSGYPHDEEAERFGRLVLPRFLDRLDPETAAIVGGLRDVAAV